MPISVLTSCDPPHVKRGIPYGQGLRRKDLMKFWNEDCMGNLRGFLVERAMTLIFLILSLSGVEIMIGKIYLSLRTSLTIRIVLVNEFLLLLITSVYEWFK